MPPAVLAARGAARPPTGVRPRPTRRPRRLGRPASRPADCIRPCALSGGDGCAPADDGDALAGDGWNDWADAPDTPVLVEPPQDADSLRNFVATLRGDGPSAAEEALAAVLDAAGAERAYLVGVAVKGGAKVPGGTSVTPEESLDELASLAETAGMEVVGRTKQSLDAINPRTYLNSGKLLELAAELAAARADTVVFDDELTPGQLRNLERALGPVARLCDRTALILDIFSQRAGSREGQLQVALAQATYQLPRLTRMWTHLERQSGSGQVKGMGEKQIEVDKRLLRTRMAGLRRDLDDVRRNRAQYRSRREEAGLPVIALVGYTSAGKSSLFNALTGAGVLADDRLFATLDPTTRRLKLPSGKEALMSDTVGFIQKLPTQLVAAFRATLEEAASAGLLLHVVDVSHPAAAAQSATVAGVLAEMGAGETPLLTVWNKVDVAPDPDAARAVAAGRADTLCVSALTGEGLEVLLAAVEAKVADGMQLVHALVPFHLAGDLLAQARASGIVAVEAYVPAGALLTARVPPALAARLAPYTVSADTVAAGAAEAAGVAEASTA